MNAPVAALLALTLLGAVAPAANFIPGQYETPERHLVFAGIEHELPDPPSIEYFDPATRRVGAPANIGGWKLISGIRERRIRIAVGGRPLGASLYSFGARRVATIVFIHGNDDETREMGFLIPYFVLHGYTVVTFDQRGSGESVGNRTFESPIDRADDVVALIAAVRSDPHVDVSRIGLWAFSNGGWTAPIVTTRVPIAFLLLKSPPAQTIESNILFEVEERMREHGYSADAIAAGARVDQLLIDALDGRASWDAAGAAFEDAQHRPWFKDLALPDRLPMPPPPEMAAALRKAALFDPAPYLKALRTPTLAMFGAFDRNVDAPDSLGIFWRNAAAAGNEDFSAHVFPMTGHTFVVATLGYSDRVLLPQTLVGGYPEIMIAWLKARQF
jgi:uncharacterized protein